LSFVLDASATLAWAIQDERTARSLAVLERLAHEKAEVPSHWALEVANGLLMATRHKHLSAAARLEALARLAELPIRADEDTAARAGHETTAIATCFGLSVYDAAYLELAIRRELPLATLDEALEAAAQATGVELLA
jgi:predicted nucleic acid-binding protein